MKCIARKFGQSTKVSLLVGILVINKVDTSKLPKFKTKEEKAVYLASLEY